MWFDGLQFKASQAASQAFVVVASVGCYMAVGVLLRLHNSDLCSFSGLASAGYFSLPECLEGVLQAA